MEIFGINMDIFGWSIVIGLGILLIAILIDGLLEDLLFDGAAPVFAIFLVCFGVSGSVGQGLGIQTTFLFGFISVIIAFIAAATFYVLYKTFKKHGERVSIPLSSDDLVGNVGTVVWWSGDTGEVLLTIKGNTMKVVAGSEDSFVTGDEVLVSESDANYNVRVIKN